MAFKKPRLDNNLTLRQINIIDYVKHHPESAALQIAKDLDISRNVIYENLLYLETRGFLDITWISWTNGIRRRYSVKTMIGVKAIT